MKTLLTTFTRTAQRAVATGLLLLCMTLAAVAAPPTSIATGQVTLNSATATAIVAADGARTLVTVRNHDVSISIYVGTSTVTAGTGILIKAGESVLITSTAAVYAISASGTPVAGYLEEAQR